MNERKDQLQRLKERISDYLADDKSLNQDELAAKIGVSPPIISLIKNGKFEERNNKNSYLITANAIRKIEEFFETESGIWEIANYKKAFNLFDDCKFDKQQGILDGPKGSGKSFTAEDFLRQYPSETFMVTCDGDMGIMDFTHDLADIIGVPKHGSRYRVRRSVGDKLWKMKSPLLIFDEMEEVSKHTIYSSIKGIYDHKKLFRHLGMVLIGANEYVQSMEHKADRKNPHSYPQMLSRFAGKVTRLDLMNQDDCKFICTTYFGITNTDLILKFYHESQQDFRRLDRIIRAYMSDLKLKNDGQDRAA